MSIIGDSGQVSKPINPPVCIDDDTTKFLIRELNDKYILHFLESIDLNIIERLLDQNIDLTLSLDTKIILKILLYEKFNYTSVSCAKINEEMKPIITIYTSNMYSRLLTNSILMPVIESKNHDICDTGDWLYNFLIKMQVFPRNNTPLDLIISPTYSGYKYDSRLITSSNIMKFIRKFKKAMTGTSITLYDDVISRNINNTNLEKNAAYTTIDDQRLVIEDHILPNDVQKDPHTDLVSSKPEYVQIFIKSYFSDHVITSIRVKLCDGIVSLKSQIQVEAGYTPEQQRLLFASKRLEDNHTLADYHIKNESSLHLVLRVCSC